MKVSINNNRVNLPDFLIVGAARSGTTSLFYSLDKHPDIFFPKNKEPFFFSFMDERPSDMMDKNFKKHLKWRRDDYIKIFSKAKKNQILGEGSTSYLYTYKKTIKNIKELYKDNYKNIKIIAILRNPVNRAFSHYLYFVRRGIERLDFQQAIKPEIIQERLKKNISYDYIGYGFYYKQVRAFKKEFPRMKIILFDEFIKNNNIMKEIFDFLEVEEKIDSRAKYSSNPSGVPKSKLAELFIRAFTGDSVLKKAIYKIFPGVKRIGSKLYEKLLKKPDMKKETRELLLSIYKDDIKKLEKLIKKDLSDWLKC